MTALGISGGQAVVLLATPALARIYTPAEFGVYASVLALAGVLASISSLRLDASIPAVPDTDVAPIFRIAVALPLLVCPVALFVLSQAAGLSGELSDFIRSLPLLPLLAIAVSQGGVTVLLAYCTRSGWFGRYAILRLTQPAFFVGIALIGVWSLETSVAFGWAVAFLFGVHYCRRTFGGLSSDSRPALRRAWKFPVMSVPLTLLDSLALALPIVFIAGNFGISDAGSYSQVQRLIGAPLVLSGMAVAQVFFKYAGEQYRLSAPVIPLMRRFVFGMTGLGIVLAGLSLAIGSEVMALLLGPGWRVDTLFLLLALTPVIARTVVSPVSSIFLITGRIGSLGCWQSAYFMVTLSVLVIGATYLTFERFLLVLAGSECIMYAAYLFLAFSIARKSELRDRRHPCAGS